MASGCVYFQQTIDGKRCVLVSPEEWRRRKGKLEQYCFNGGKGCPVLMSMYVNNGGAVFLNKLRKSKSTLK
ncbi:MAG: metal-binding protein [Thermoprotei archaeon]|nr:MAG: metal-binding protein [Thermoprotei archaeon]RLF00294.1 MAG: metal-binding protein [Thermoprotei archaeon]HDI74945.1 metal-binding protein [Thermoprotei archaeon]